ncbi:F510_1955 family glycosylhydrolase [Occultella aeris]|uniref:BNR/Asp-box repeat protein n=1 Tax=Occultella aeris TaxID=2761496 RepID=A0A7M4DKR1_9MICO|nr:exo-alpha-sialidase [Occultella aeris]VZO37752.1 BNR/Asp-box repeat protein [Occultella aeris]
MSILNRRSARTATTALTLLVALTGCSAGRGQSPPPVDTSEGVGHVHAVATNMGADTGTYVATHTGLYLVGEEGLVRVGETRSDLMSFTVIGPDTFLASGHPAPGEGGPSSLGLIRSTDAGLTWAEVSLGGESDFHALTAVDERIYGLDATTSTLRWSTDQGTRWQEGAQITAADLDADPAAPDRVLATTPDGLMLSADGGATFARTHETPEPLVLIDHVTTGAGSVLLGLDAAGVLWRELPRGWRSMGPGIGTPEAFWALDEQTLTASADGAVHRSTDGGATWSVIATID